MPLTNKDYSKEGTFINAVRIVAKKQFSDPLEKKKFEEMYTNKRQAAKFRSGKGLIWNLLTERE